MGEKNSGAMEEGDGWNLVSAGNRETSNVKRET